MFVWLRRFGVQCVLVTAVGMGLCAGAQGQAQISDAALLGELRSLSERAGTVFVGQIVAIERRPGYVDVDFRVEQPVRGITGSRFVLREWAGLWAPGAGRYAPGRRVLAFLHGKAASGLSSPVHGDEGLVPVVVQSGQTPSLLDVRRVAASVLRSPDTPLLTEANGAFLLPQSLEYLADRGNATNIVRVSLPGARVHAEATLPGALRVEQVPRPSSIVGGQMVIAGEASHDAAQ